MDPQTSGSPFDEQPDHTLVLSRSPLENKLWRRLPFEIRRAFRFTHFTLLKRRDRERFRDDPNVQYWIPSNGRWQQGNFARYQHNSGALALVATPAQVPTTEDENNTGNDDKLQAPDVIAVNTGYQPNRHRNTVKYKRKTNAQENRPTPVFQTTSLGLRIPDTIVLEQGTHTVRKRQTVVWQASSSAEALAAEKIGHPDVEELFFFEATCHRHQPPQPGQTVVLFVGWQVELKGWVSHYQGVTVQWQGPVSGEKFIGFDARYGDEHDWTITLDLPPGKYQIVARAGDLVRTQTLKVIGIKAAQFGVFFDGTGKNYPYDRMDTNDKYEPSNIGKLYELYPQNIGEFTGASYVYGIGMEDLAHEIELSQPPRTNLIAKAFGLGVKKRLDMAFNELNRFLTELRRSILDELEYTKLNLVVDVFGYSRGAAIARIFINELKRNHRLGLFSDLLPVISVDYRILGLLDTVGSIGIPGIERIAGYNMNLKFGSARCVYQLTALHEQRAFFPLSSIKSPPGQLTPHTFIEEPLPGVHADIGGGQLQRHEPKITLLDRKKYSYVRSRTDLQKNHVMRQINSRLEELKQEWVEWGGEVKVEQDIRDFPAMDTVEIYCDFILLRFIEPDLEHVALHKIYEKSKALNVPFLPLTHLGVLGLRFELSETLNQNVVAALSGQLVASKWLKAKKVHISHEPLSTMGIPVGVDMMERNPVYTTEFGVREKFFNKPELAES